MPKRDAPSAFGARVEALFARVLAPLVLGGRLAPVRPLGRRYALRLLEGHVPADRELASRVDVARVRRARLLVPVDTLAPPSGAEWALAASLSDLLQASNPELASALDRARPAKLLAEVAATLERVPPPRTLHDALSRHATFARAFELVRVDTTVGFWVGQREFHGARPPARLLAWPSLRRVRVDEKRLGVAELADAPGTVERAAYLDVLGAWLARSPLTDLATLGRAEPRFAWNASNLALVASDPGLALAVRAARDLSPDPAGWAPSDLVRAREALARRTTADRLARADAFARELSLAKGVATRGRANDSSHRGPRNPA